MSCDESITLCLPHGCSGRVHRADAAVWAPTSYTGPASDRSGRSRVRAVRARFESFGLFPQSEEPTMRTSSVNTSDVGQHHRACHDVEGVDDVCFPLQHGERAERDLCGDQSATAPLNEQAHAGGDRARTHILS